MAVFHPNHDDLHGFTVCISTSSGVTYVGRWDHEHEGRILLVGACLHRDGDDGMSSPDFVKRAALWGVQPELPNVVVERGDVTDVRRLGDVAKELRGW